MIKVFIVLLITTFNANATTKVVITIDDLPIHSDIPKEMNRVDIAKKMLSTLKEENIPEAYGFINASKAEFQSETKEVLKLWVKAGYPLGNHTYTHLSLHHVSVPEFEKDILANEKMLQELNGNFNWKIFRYPYLREGETLEKRNAIRNFLASNGYSIAQVSIDFEDWSWNNPYVRCLEKKDSKTIKWLTQSYQENALAKLLEAEKMAQALLKRDIPHILLLHIGVFDAEMLSQLIKNFKNHGVQFISLSEALKDELYQTNQGIPAKWGSEILHQVKKARNLTMKDLGLSSYEGYPEKQLETICL